MFVSVIATYLVKFLTTLLSLITMMSPVAGKEGVTYSPEKPDEVIASFVVVSDIHVETNNPKPYDAMADLLYGIKAGEDYTPVIML